MRQQTRGDSSRHRSERRIERKQGAQSTLRRDHARSLQRQRPLDYLRSRNQAAAATPSKIGALPSPPPEAIAEIPQGLVAQMCEAVEDGDMVLLAELTREVQKINPQTARALQLLADQYEYNTLLVWLNKGERGDD